MTLELAYTETGEGPALVILHGLFGSGRNWASVARKLGETHRVFTVDLRNHGASPWAETMDYAEMADDVRAFLVRHGLAGATVMGHSMGGKTAMRLALEHEGDVGRLIVVDIAPVAYTHTHLPFVEAMRAVDLAAAGRRADVDEQLQAAIPEAAMRGFLLHNLIAEDGRLTWRINLAALATNMPALIGYPETWAAAPTQARRTLSPVLRPTTSAKPATRASVSFSQWPRFLASPTPATGSTPNNRRPFWNRSG